MMNLDLGALVVHLNMDESKFEKGLRRAEKRMKSAAKSMAALGAKMSLAITAPLALMAKSAISSFSDFDDAMTKSLSVFGDVAPEMRKQMEDMANFISSKSVTSAVDLADAYFALGSAGFSAKRAMEELATVEKFAVAGAFNMKTATALLTKAQKTLGLTSKDAVKNHKQMVRVANVLVKANMLAGASVQEFSEALTNEAAAAMKTYGIELEEGVAMLAIYADQAIVGMRGGSTFARMLKLTTNAVIKNSKEFKKMGIEIFNAQGGFLPLTDVIKNMSKKLGVLSVKEKAAKLAMLGFQAEAQNAILPLLGMSSEVKRFNKELKDVEGVMDKMAKHQLESFKAQMIILGHRIDIVRREIAIMLIPSIKRMNKFIGAGLIWWSKLNKSTKSYIVTMLQIAMVTGPVLVGMATFIHLSAVMVSGIRNITFAVRAMRLAFISAWHAALLPAIIIAAKIALVGAAVAAVAYLIVGPKGMNSAWITVKKSAIEARAAMKGFLNDFKTNMSGLRNWISKNWGNLWKAMTTHSSVFFDNIKTNIAAFVVTGLKLFAGFIGWLDGAFYNVVLNIYQYWLELKNKFVDVIIGIIGYMRGLYNEFSNWMGNLIDSMLGGIFHGMLSVTSSIISFLESVHNYGKNFIFNIINDSIIMAVKLGRSIGKVFNEISGFFHDLFTDFTKTINKVIITIWEMYKAFFTWMKDAAYNVFSIDFVYSIVDGLALAYKKIVKWANNVGKVVKDSLTGGFGKVADEINLFAGDEMRKGRQEQDLGKTLSDILKSNTDKFQSPFKGIEKEDSYLQRFSESVMKSWNKSIDDVGGELSKGWGMITQAYDSVKASAEKYQSGISGVGGIGTSDSSGLMGDKRPEISLAGGGFYAQQMLGIGGANSLEEEAQDTREEALKVSKDMLSVLQKQASKNNSASSGAILIG